MASRKPYLEEQWRGESRLGLAFAGCSLYYRTRLDRSSQLQRDQVIHERFCTLPPRNIRNQTHDASRIKARASHMMLDAAEHPAPEVIYLSDSWVAVNKPPGVLVHRTKLYHANPNDVYLVDEVAKLVSERTGTAVPVLPVQRLDRPTSGVMVFALGTSADAARLQAALQSPEREKLYWAIASGADMPEEWVNDHPLTDLTGKRRKSRPARTEFQQLARLAKSDVSIVSAKISTGRQHQIRRHLSNARHPVLGDTSHGKGEINRRARESFGVTRCCLHSWNISFTDPDSASLVKLRANIPKDLQRVLSHFEETNEDGVGVEWMEQSDPDGVQTKAVKFG